MLTLLVLTRFDASGAAPRYRVYQYLDFLQKNGIQVQVQPLLDKTYIDQLYQQQKRSIFYLLKKYIQRALFLLLNKKKFQLVFMDGELFPFLPYFLEKFFLPKRYVIDQDDAIFHTYDNHRLSVIRKLFGKKIEKIWKDSEHIIVGNAYVEEKALGFGARSVSVLPTVVDSDKYKPSTHCKKNQENESIIIGWVGSPPTVSSLNLITPVLKNLAKKTNISLHVIGAHFEIAGIHVLCNSWAEGWNEEQEIEQINNIDIGIMPLYAQTPYEKGKCGFKLIKYMACEKPMVASKVGMNLEIVDHNKNGFLASTLDEWEEYLLKLIENPELREQFGKCGREKMIKKYSLKATANVFSRIILNNFKNMDRVKDSV